MDYREQIQEFSDTCIRCGLCAQTDCGNYSEGTPCLGDICESLLNGEEDYIHFPYTCALCGRCTADCPVDLTAISGLKPCRALILDKNPELRSNYRHFRTDLRYNLFSMVQGVCEDDIRKYSNVEGELLGDEVADSTAFFPGCSLNSYSPELVQKAFNWLRENKIASRKLNFCCGATFYDTGFFDEFQDYKAKVIAFLKEWGIKRLVISCPHCGFILPEIAKDAEVELVRLPQLMVKAGVRVSGTGTYSVHDACYDRQEGKYGADVRKMFENWDLVPLEHEGRHTICCGGGGMVSAYAPAYCEYRRNQRLAEIDAVDSDVLVSTCFSCVNSMQRGESSKPVKHYLELVLNEDVDWGDVYGRVNLMYADPDASELFASEERLFE